MTTHAERRTAARTRTPADFRLRLPGHTTPAQVVDLSSTGVRCTTERPIQLLSQVQVTFLLPDAGGTREVTCTGAVVRCTNTGGSAAPGYETAIYFTDVDDADRAALDTFVSSLRRIGLVA